MAGRMVPPPHRIKRIFERIPELSTLGSPENEVDVLETMGKGNFGYVYKATIKSLQNLVSAVKVVTLKESELIETWQEVQILKECSHPNIVGFHNAYLQGLNLWIAMEYCGASSIDTLYGTILKPLSDVAIACIISESLKGLSYFHETGHIHRDIKAGNILLTEDGHIKLADFGVSSRLNMPNKKAQSFIGTPFWMAPEVIRSENDIENWYDAKVDIWSIGITVIELAQKAPPLCEFHPLAALKIIVSGSQKLGLLNPKKRTKPLVDFIARCLERDPKKRPSADSLLSHEFLKKTEKLLVNQLLKDLVDSAKAARLHRMSISRSGSGGNDDDDDDVKYQIPEKAAESTGDTSGIINLDTNQENIPEFDDSARHSEEVSTRRLLQTDKRFPITQDVFCAEIYSGYLLLGTDNGLFVVDINKENTALPNAFACIPSVRFRKIKILPELKVMIAICGKNDHIRQYTFATLFTLIAMVLQDDRSRNNSYHYVNEENKKMKEKMLVNDKNVVEHPFNRFVKIAATKGTSSFVVERTAGSIFVLAMIKGNTLTLLEWAKEPYLKFMKVKDFWLPETPKFYSIIHDGFFVRSIVVGYSTETNILDVEHAKVNDFMIDPKISDKYKDAKKAKNAVGSHENITPSTLMGKVTGITSGLSGTGAGGITGNTSFARSGSVSSVSSVFFGSSGGAFLRGLRQVGVDQQMMATLSVTLKRQGSVNRKIAAAVSPYSNDIKLSSQITGSCILTYENLSCLTDLNGKTFENPVFYEWSAVPQDFAVVANKYIIAVCEKSIEVSDFNTGEKFQIVSHGSKLQFLCYCGSKIVVTSKISRRESLIAILSLSMNSS